MSHPIPQNDVSPSFDEHSSSSGKIVLRAWLMHKAGHSTNPAVHHDHEHFYPARMRATNMESSMATLLLWALQSCYCGSYEGESDSGVLKTYV